MLIFKPFLFLQISELSKRGQIYECLQETFFESFINFIYAVTGSRHIQVLLVVQYISTAGFHSDVVACLSLDYSDLGSILAGTG